LDLNPPFARFLKTWGEAGIVTIKSRNFLPKEMARGITCMMIRYSLERPTGTFRMFDPNTRGVHVTRDVTWLRRKFFPRTDVEVGEGTIPLIEVPDHSLQIDAADPTIEEVGDGEPENTMHEEQEYNEEEENPDNHAVATTRSGRGVMMPSYLLDDYETSLVGAGIGGGFVNTNELNTIKFDDVMASDGRRRDMEFTISGRSDAEYASDPETRRSVSGGTVFQWGTVIHAFSRMQKCVTLSVMEAKFVAAFEAVQNICFARSVINSFGLKVKLPMLIEEDNKSAVDLINSWSATGRIRHIATSINFLRELKEQGLLAMQWISNVGMSSDTFTKNVGG
jgi:hypothetical protein